jgi:hypothetical protein
MLAEWVRDSRPALSFRGWRRHRDRPADGGWWAGSNDSSQIPRIFHRGAYVSTPKLLESDRACASRPRRLRGGSISLHSSFMGVPFDGSRLSKNLNCWQGFLRHFRGFAEILPRDKKSLRDPQTVWPPSAVEEFDPPPAPIARKAAP